MKGESYLFNYSQEKVKYIFIINKWWKVVKSFSPVVTTMSG